MGFSCFRMVQCSTAFMIVASFALMITAGVVRYWWIYESTNGGLRTLGKGAGAITIQTGGRTEEGIWRQCITTLTYNNRPIKTDAELEALEKELKKHRHYNSYSNNNYNDYNYNNNNNYNGNRNRQNNYNSYDKYNRNNNNKYNNYNRNHRITSERIVLSCFNRQDILHFADTNFDKDVILVGLAGSALLVFVTFVFALTSICQRYPSKCLIWMEVIFTFLAAGGTIFTIVWAMIRKDHSHLSWAFYCLFAAGGLLIFSFIFSVIMLTMRAPGSYMTTRNEDEIKMLNRNT